MAFTLGGPVLVLLILSQFGTRRPLIPFWFRLLLSLCSQHRHSLVSHICLVARMFQLILTYTLYLIHLTVVHTVKLTFRPLSSFSSIYRLDLSWTHSLFIYLAFSLYIYIRSTQPFPTTPWGFVCWNIIAIYWMLLFRLYGWTLA